MELPPIAKKWLNKLKAKFPGSVAEWAWKHLLAVTSPFLIGGLVAAWSFLKRVWLGTMALMSAIWSVFWPPTEVQAWCYGVYGSALLVVFAVTAYRWWKRNNHDEERAQARQRRIKAKTAATKRARKKNPNAPSATISEGVLAESYRDPFVRRTWVGSMVSSLIALVLISLLVANHFSLASVVFWRTGHAPSELSLVARRDDRTLSTGITDKEGHCEFYREITEGEIEVIAYRVVDGFIEWSELKMTASPTNREIEFRDFPQYRCPLKTYGPMYFQKSRHNLKDADKPSVIEAQHELKSLDGLILIEGRTCNTPFYLTEAKDNYQLSLERCEEIAGMMAVTIDRSKLIPAPLEYHQPIEADLPAKQSLEKHRSVRILVFQRIPVVQP